MWEISNYNQLISFLLSICLGAIFCMAYDVLRAFRRVFSNSFLAVTIQDILIWVLYAFTTFIFLISQTNGEVRGYVLFGEGIGFCIFRISISKLWLLLLQYFFLGISGVLRSVRGLLARIYASLGQKTLIFKKGLIEIGKSIKKLLKNMLRVLYTNKNIADSEKDAHETKTKA